MKLPMVVFQLQLTHKQRIAASMMMECKSCGMVLSYRELSRAVGLLLPAIKQLK